MNSIELKNIINQYLDESGRMLSKYKPLSGIFGFGKGPKDDECHMRFFETIENADFDKSDAFECVKTLLFADRDFNPPDISKGFVTAVSQFAIDLIPYISDDQREMLLKEYDAYVPKRQRLPIQDNIVKALSAK